MHIKSCMKITVAVVCYKQKQLENGNFPLLLRLTKNRKLKYLSLGISINPIFWDFNKGIPKRNCPNKEVIRTLTNKKIDMYN